MSPSALGVVLQAVDVPGGGSLDVTFGVGGGAIGAALTTLCVGAVLVALVPDYTVRKMDAVRDEPVESFLYGIFTLLAVVLMAFFLFISFVGIVVAVPLVVLSLVLWAVGAAIGFLAIAERLVGREDGWLKPLVVAAALDGGLTLTGVGALLALGVGAAGFGAVLRDYLE